MLFLVRYWKVLVAVAAGAWLYSVGLSSGRTEVQHRWDLYKLDVAAETIKQQADFRRREHQLQLKVWEVGDELDRKLRAVRSEADTVLADVRNDNLQLRDKFRGCTRRVSEARSPTPVDDGTGNSGLSDEDQRVVIRLAERADKTVAKLTACQKYVTETLLLLGVEGELADGG